MSSSKAKLVNGKLSGVINTLEHYFGFELEPLRNASSEKAPTHEIFAKKSNGTHIKIGVAWERIMQRGERQGLAMYSLAFDDPMFTTVLTFSSFPENNEGDYSVNFERPRQNAPVNNVTLSELAPPQNEDIGGQAQQAA
jgi:uncharacterized protein (DUF736 family)